MERLPDDLNIQVEKKTNACFSIIVHCMKLREVKMAKSEANVALIGSRITLNISKSSSLVITSLTNGCFSFTMDFVKLSRDG